MSETEYGRLADKLGEIATDIGVIKSRLESYNDHCAMLIRHDKEIELIKTNCQAIQTVKSNKILPWGSVKGAILGGIIVGVVMMIINLVIRYAN